MAVSETPTLDPSSAAAGDTGAVILFDGVCNLCNSSVNFVIDRDRGGYFQFAALQSDAGRRLIEQHGLSGDYLDSILLIEGGRCVAKSGAALRIARRMRGLWRVAFLLIVIPAPLRDMVYNWVARNRYRWFGKQDTCRVPTPELASRFLT